MGYSLFEDALDFAQKAHNGVTRKGNNMPFIIHPVEVAAIVASITEKQEVLAAALLHDTVEDADISLEEIEEKFGPRVKELVASETENKRREMLAEDSWQIRKEESLDELKNSDDRDVKILWLADKLSNMRSFYRLYQKKQEKLWEDFHQKDPRKQEWYYRSVAEYTNELKDTVAYKEYIDLIEKVFGGQK